MNDLIQRALDEDAPWGDVTSELLVPEGAELSVSVVAREPGVLAGMKVLVAVSEMVDDRCTISSLLADGAKFEPGAVLARVQGPARSILRAERIALNFIQHLSGIATQTASFVSAVDGTRARIVDTHKTTPGMRLLEKAAVVAGGGHNHRFPLSDAVLVKDNHLATPGALENLATLRERLPHTTHVEIEVDRIDQIPVVLDARPDSILCDNFSNDDLRRAVEMIGGRALVNASGGVTLTTVRGVAETGVDLISVGALTHSVMALDIGLDAQ